MFYFGDYVEIKDEGFYPGGSIRCNEYTVKIYLDKNNIERETITRISEKFLVGST